MEILSYVADLIQSRKEIDIFGLGTIYKKKSPGRYDTATHTFLPPSYQIAFSQEQSGNDFLPEYIAAQRHISRESADYFISVFVAEINEQLATQGNADLSPLGTLVATEDLLRFEPNQDFKTGFEFYGLPTVKNVIPPTTEQTNIEKIPLTFAPIETAENITEEEVFDTDAAEDQPEEITMPEDSIEEVKDLEILTEEDPAPIHPLEQIETPESDILVDDDDEFEIDIADNEKEALIETSISSESIDHFNLEEQEQTTALNQDPAPEEDAVETEDNDIQEITEVETVKPEVEEEIQLENLLEEENPGQESKEEIFNDSAASSFYAASSSASSENTIQYIIPENGNTTGNPTYVKILIGVAAALFLALLAYIIIPMLPESFKKPAISVDSTKKKAVIATPQFTDTAGVEDSVATSTATTPASIKESPTVKPAPLKDVPLVKAKVDTATLYEIIGASVANQNEANQFIAQMKKSGITAKIATNVPGKRLKMSIATFKDEKAARLERARLEKKLKIDGIYIYINKPE